MAHASACTHSGHTHHAQHTRTRAPHTHACTTTHTPRHGCSPHTTVKTRTHECTHTLMPHTPHTPHPCPCTTHPCVHHTYQCMHTHRAHHTHTHAPHTHACTTHTHPPRHSCSPHTTIKTHTHSPCQSDRPGMKPSEAHIPAWLPPPSEPASPIGLSLSVKKKKKNAKCPRRGMSLGCRK